MSMMQVLDSSGHTSVEWNPENAEEVAVARATFEQMREKGYRAFRVRPSGQQGERLDSFDPAAEQMILVPQLRGG
jgi:hypothetical protein